MSSSAFNALLLSAVIAASMAAALVGGFQFEVGAKTGWRKPTGEERETYNEWATRNRFHIKDTLHFKYEMDSVLVVSAADYLKCNTANPIAKFEDGNTVFEFDRSGFFYFISGESHHCKSGQRLIIRVMHPSEVEAAAPELAPLPSAAGGDWAAPPTNSTEKFSVVSYFFTALAGLSVVVYLFM